MRNAPLLSPTPPGEGRPATAAVRPALLLARLAAPLLALALSACGGQATTPIAAERVENPERGLAIAALPAVFQVTDNAGEVLRLSAPEVAGGGVEITIGPLQLGGINLVEVVKERRAAFEAEGLYFGNRELMTPYGPAYTTRGQLSGPDGPVEETAVYSLHPDGSDRLMTVTYRYPGGGDSQARVGELLELLGELEAL